MSHASGKKATFGELADAASAIPVPASVTLKDPKDFVYVGKHVPRTDSAAKSNGSALFTQDVELPGMLTALVLHPPRFGARVKSFDASALKGIPGVRTVVERPTGVAVLATGFWAAMKGRDALKVEWNDSRSWRGRRRADGRVSQARGDAGQGRARRWRRGQGDRGRGEVLRAVPSSRTSRMRRWSR